MRGEELARALGERLGGSVAGLRPLSGGASRETWSFQLDGRPLILRSGMGLEAEAIRAAADVGVPVPELVDASDDVSILGAAYLVMVHVDGETTPRKILRDAEFAAARPLLARQCGEILARIHTVAPSTVPRLADVDQVAQYRAVLDSLGEPHPTFELAFRWLEEHRPTGQRRTMVHGDFRNGNLIVGPEGIRAVIDWELVHAGDPMEDLGWLCVKSWRFGVSPRVGGFGSVEDLADGYGTDVDLDALRWWEVLGTLKWGIMAITQAMVHTRGARRSVELAAIGRRVCELEWDLLETIGEPARRPRGSEAP
jgi:aminoglycoside phosphotransferase (APT) family kinase protein